MKYRALVSFAGPVLSMFATEVKEIEEEIAKEFVDIGYVIAIDDNSNNAENAEENDGENESNGNEDTIVETKGKKGKNTKKGQVK